MTRLIEARERVLEAMANARRDAIDLGHPTDTHDHIGVIVDMADLETLLEWEA